VLLATFIVKVASDRWEPPSPKRIHTPARILSDRAGSHGKKTRAPEEQMEIEAFFDEATFTLTYVAFDTETRDAVIIDPVLDYDPASSQTDTRSAEKLIAFVQANRLRVRLVLETHAHADHLSSSQLLKRQLEAEVAIGEDVRGVQRTFHAFFALGEDVATDGSQFDRLIRDGEIIEAGSLRIRAIATPGHTPACMTYLIDDAAFTGDALFIEDYGVGRCDFPGGSASELYHSVHDRLYALPDETRVLVGHDYMPGGREMRFETTIGISKRENVQLRTDTTEDEFVTMRQARDATLAPPRLLFPSVQVNINAGLLPRSRATGRRFLSVPDQRVPTERRDGRPARLYESDLTTSESCR
jgi:glyoxylase-like metal-dependent hydrolase (beta-lactamase superfamily II)